MIKILFVCHGNICRSPMAEFVMKDLVKKTGLSDEFYVASAATSTEEIVNGVHYGTRKKLAEFGISVDGKYAVQLKKSDYAKYDPTPMFSMPVRICAIVASMSMLVLP